MRVSGKQDGNKAAAVLRLPENDRGVDYVVGDIHGAFDQVEAALERVGFDDSRDRLLCVGDLVDRGPRSADCVAFASRPGVFAALGNHEAMIRDLHERGEPHPATLAYAMRHNGFSWWRDASPAVRADVVALARRLPYAIEVATPRGTVGIVHADVPAGMDWATFKDRLEAGDEATVEVATWGRDRIQNGDLSGVAGIGRLFVGHTPLAKPARFANVYAVDTGAVFGALKGEGFLTMGDIAAMTNAYTTFGSTRAPRDLVHVVASARAGRPFSGIDAGA